MLKLSTTTPLLLLYIVVVRFYIMTAIEWLYEILTTEIWEYKTFEEQDEIFKKAKEMERNQHGNTWDAAIKAHDERGHVFVRSTCDFDDYEIS